jgi:hypothetical protein
VQSLCSGGGFPHASEVQETVDGGRRRAAYKHVSEIDTSTAVLSLSFCPALRSSACATLELPTWYSNYCSSNSPQNPSCPGTREECCISCFVAWVMGQIAVLHGHAQLPVTVWRPPCCSAPWARRHLATPLLRHRLPKLASLSQLTTQRPNQNSWALPRRLAFAAITALSLWTVPTHASRACKWW